MFINKEYKVIGRRPIGNDPFTSETIYVNDYQTIKVPVWSHIVMAVIAMVIVVIGSIIGVSIVIVSSNDTAAISNTTTTTMVEETTTTVAEVTAVTVQEAITKVTQTAAEYVCDTYTGSTEYILQVATMVDETTYDIPWETMRDRHVVFQWNMDNTYLSDFKADVALFALYTHMDVRVVSMEYIPAPEDYLVPVISEDIEGMGWADMNVGVTVSDVFGIKVVDIASAMLRFDQLAFNNWQYHTHMVLHELGHMVGLGHTHEAQGEQTDSIMSYESDHSHAGYMAGDIAGLKEVLCK